MDAEFPSEFCHETFSFYIDATDEALSVFLPFSVEAG